MSYPHTSDIVGLELPLSGLNFRVPITRMGNEFTPWAYNWIPETWHYKMRNGVKIHSTPGSTVLAIGKRSTKLFAYVQPAAPTSNTIYELDSGVAVSSEVTGSAVSDEAYPVNFNGRLMFATEADYANNMRTYDGSSWAASGFTNGGSPIGGRVITTYNGRVYIFNGTDMYYSDLAAVTGTTTKIELSSRFKSNAEIAFAAAISSPGQKNDATFLVIGNKAGEVLIYGGSYPADASWSELYRFEIPPIVDFNSILIYENDIWVFTKSKIVSIRDLFLKSPDEETVSSNIDPHWTKLVGRLSVSGSYKTVSAAFWPEQNKIYILVPGWVDFDITSATYQTIFESIATMYVYNCATKAWGLIRLDEMDDSCANVGGLTYFDNNLYWFNGGHIMTFDTGYKDETISTPEEYSSYFHTLNGPFLNFGSMKKAKQVHGYELIYKTDWDGGSIGVAVAADFGKKISAYSYQTPVDGFNALFFGAGAQGNVLQYRISGTSDIESTDGAELYSIGVSLS